ncbi:MAG: RHS repeat protein [Deltaproteobacteria bacterium]|nr:RHS repeat protein [Deltaproteobacteria bacterium]
MASGPCQSTSTWPSTLRLSVVFLWVGSAFAGSNGCGTEPSRDHEFEETSDAVGEVPGSPSSGAPGSCPADVNARFCAPVTGYYYTSYYPLSDPYPSEASLLAAITAHHYSVWPPGEGYPGHCGPEYSLSRVTNGTWQNPVPPDSYFQQFYLQTATLCGMDSWPGHKPTTYFPSPFAAGWRIDRHPICPLPTGPAWSFILHDWVCSARWQDLMDPKDCSAGNPTDIRTGTKIETVGVVDPVGPAGLDFALHYASTLGRTSSARAVNWRHTYDRSVALNGSLAILLRPAGSAIIFQKSGSTWRAPAGLVAALTTTTTVAANTDGDGSGGGSGDGREDIAGWTFRDEYDNVETYDASGRLVSIARSGGKFISLTYTNGRLISVSDAYRHTIAFAYDAAGHLVTVRDPADRAHTLAYDEFDNLASVTAPNGTVRRFVYAYMDGEEPGASARTTPSRALLTGKIDEAGTRYATFAYNAEGRVASTEHTSGVQRHAFAYGRWKDAWNYSYPETIVTDPAGRETIYQYRETGYSSVTDSVSRPCCGGASAQKTTFDSDGNAIAKTDFLGNKTTYAYNGKRQPVRIIEAAGTPEAQTMDVAWHSTLNKPTQIDEPGRRTSLDWDLDGNLVKETVTDTATSESRTRDFTYNQGLLTAVDGPLAGPIDRTRFEWNFAKGNLRRIINPLGQTTTFTGYDAHGRPTTITDANGVAAAFKYTLSGDIATTTIDPLGTNPDVTSFTYNRVGQMIRRTRSAGLVLLADDRARYDSAHRLVSLKDLHGNILELTRGLDDKITRTELKDARGKVAHTSTLTYDARRRLADVIDADGVALMSFRHDDNGQVTSVSRPQNTLTRGYDPLGRLISSTDTMGTRVAFAYDPLGQLTRVVDPRGVATNSTFDAFGSILSTTSADRGSTRMTFRADGRPVSMTDAAGRTTHFAFDVRGRMTLLAMQDGEQIQMGYDQGQGAVGRLTHMQDASGSTTWGFDRRGRLTSKVHDSGSARLAMSIAYDDASRVATVTYPSGRVLSVTYASAPNGSRSTDRPLAIAAEGDPLSTDRPLALIVDGKPILDAISYSASGEITKWRFGNGQAYRRAFDRNGRIIHNGLGPLAYDTAGRITALTSDDASYAFTYDAFDRLIRVSAAATHAIANAGASTDANTNTNTYTYAYDRNGNWTSVTEGDATRTFTIDANSNRLLSSTPGPTQYTQYTQYTYDATGALVSDGTRTLTYDSLGRVVGATMSTTRARATYARNGRGERVAKSVNGLTTRFFYDPSGRLLGEYTDSGAPIQEYVYLGNLPVAILRPRGIYYIKADELATPRAVVDAKGKTVWSWARRPFGATPPSGSFKLNLRYPGQYYDAETGLFENHHRIYDPELGRYLQSDPTGLAGGLNTYAYANGNPIMVADPLGLAGTTTTQSENLAVLGDALRRFVRDLTDTGERDPDALGNTKRNIADIMLPLLMPEPMPYLNPVGHAIKTTLRESLEPWSDYLLCTEQAGRAIGPLLNDPRLSGWIFRTVDNGVELFGKHGAVEATAPNGEVYIVDPWKDETYLRPPVERDMPYSDPLDAAMTGHVDTSPMGSLVHNHGVPHKNRMRPCETCPKPPR